MVTLHCLPARGNAGGRYFPHSGFLALTQVKVEGLVRTRLDDDRKPILATQIAVTVRCYEARLGRLGAQSTNVLAEYSQILWPHKGDDGCHEPAPIGDSDHPFRIVIPARCPGGQSTAHFQNYRVYWRIEATCIHQPIPGLGTRMTKGFDVLLTRHDAVLSRAPHPSHSQTALVSTLRKPRCSTPLNYSVAIPTSSPIGPLDIVPVAIRVRPVDDRISVAAYSLSIERRILLHDSPVSSPASDAPITVPASLSSLSIASSTVPLLAGRSTPSIIVAGKPTTFLVASADATNIPRDDLGFFSKTLHAPLPAAKTANHWALGETLCTTLATIAFFVRIKVSLSNGETVELDEQELHLNATNASDRELIMAKHPEQFEKHRRRTSGLPASPKPSSSSRSSRRPHTSAGDSARRCSTVPRSMGRTIAKELAAPPPPPPPLPPPVPVPALDPAVRAWEEELARIESQSRHRSAEVNARKRTKLTPAVAVA